MPRLGQHFLKNKAALKKIADEIVSCGAVTVVEVGAGHGELTGEMVKSNPPSGGQKLKLVAVEKDPRLAEALRKKFSHTPRVEIVEEDIRRWLPLNFQLLISNEEHWAIVGNIPYYLTAYLLRLLGELPEKPAECVVTVQREVAERVTAKPPHMNKLAAAVQFWAEPEIILRLRREDFSPPPKVASAVLKLTPKTGGDAVDAKTYYALLKTLFANPRKTLLNNLKGSSGGRAAAQEALRACGINPAARPQNLSVEDIERIAATLPQRAHGGGG